MFKATSGETPHFIHSLFTRSTSRYVSDNFIPPRPRTDLYKNSLAFSGSSTWNSPPPSLKDLRSINTYMNTLVPAYLSTMPGVSHSPEKNFKECVHSFCARISIILAQALCILAHFTYVTLSFWGVCVSYGYVSVFVSARTFRYR